MSRFHRGDQVVRLRNEYRFEVKDVVSFYNGEPDRIYDDNGTFFMAYELAHEADFVPQLRERLSAQEAQVGAMEKEVINQPQHYTQGGVEVIDIIRDAVGGDKPAQPFEAVALANCIKYLLRYRFKNGSEDLKKCRRYLDWLIEDVQKQEREAVANEE